jgi:DHA1 family tetracycline resistance protein-like MFS transporter
MIWIVAICIYCLALPLMLGIRSGPAAAKKPAE